MPFKQLEIRCLETGIYVCVLNQNFLLALSLRSYPVFGIRRLSRLAPIPRNRFIEMNKPVQMEIDGINIIESIKNSAPATFRIVAKYNHGRVLAEVDNFPLSCKNDGQQVSNTMANAK